MRCPRDNVVLVEQSSNGAVLHCCPRCGGLWLGRAGLEACLSAGRPADHRDGAAVVDRRNMPAPCPVDGAQEMVQHVYHGIQVDVCRKHEGIWLDRGELERLVAIWRKAAARTGGPLDARQIAELVVPKADAEGEPPSPGVGLVDAEVAQAAVEFGLWVLLGTVLGQ